MPGGFPVRTLGFSLPSQRHAGVRTLAEGCPPSPPMTCLVEKGSPRLPRFRRNKRKRGVTRFDGA